jgi:trimeric autotransporter adhesin
MKKILLILMPYTLFLIPCTFSQNIGIGTTTPVFKLDVKNGSINTDSVYRIGGSKVLSINLQNTFVGIGTANSITTGNFNTAAGYEALYSNTIGERNTAFGLWALYSNTGGNRNTAFGKSALHLNSTGSYNAATGYDALYYNTTGEYNTATGYQSLLFNTTGIHNTAIAYRALFSNTTGVENTATGTEALYNTTGGFRNTATGRQALYSNTDGSYNAAHGTYALYYNTGDLNTANGSWALYYNTTGDGNTASGFQSLYYNTGYANTAFGREALYNNSLANFNTACGMKALYTNTSGYGNTAIGCIADVSSGTLVNATAIGYDAKVDASNKVRIGNTYVNSIGGQVGWSNFSDGRYKQNVQEDVPGIAFINKLRPVTYTVDVKSLDENYYKVKPGMAAAANTSYRHTGFIAQEVEKSATELGFSFSGVDKPQQQEGLYGLRYAEFVVPLVKAVQELSKEIDLLKEQNKMLLQLLNKKN